MKAYHDGHPAHKLGDEPVFREILGFNVGEHLVGNFIVGELYLAAEAERRGILALLHYLVESDKRAAADEQYISRVYPQALLLGVLSAALRGNVCNGAFDYFKERLLYALARDVAGD